eukprot:NODE_29_length_37665_cov_1.081563.p20 type:complete len:192 gc:universal NODE_29_length_37665_cov_1.081563:8955-9530(+)
MTSARNGKLIVVEGIDRSGKSTLVQRLSEHFDCIKSGFPNRNTPIGKLINQILTREVVVDDINAIHLLFTANRWELQTQLSEWLKNENVILDRYIYSGIAYSVAQGIDLEWCLEKETGLLVPDKVIYLDLDAKVSAERKGFGDELYEKEKFLSLVTEAFKIQKDKNWMFIDATKSIDEVFEEAVSFIKESK